MPFAVVEEAEYAFVSLLSGKLLFLCVKVFLNAEHIGGEINEATHILNRTAATYESCAVVAEIVAVKSFHCFAVRLSVAVNNSFVTLVSYVLADTILITCAEDASAIAAVLCIKLHHCVECCAAAGEEIEYCRFKI